MCKFFLSLHQLSRQFLDFGSFLLEQILAVFQISEQFPLLAFDFGPLLSLPLQVLFVLVKLLLKFALHLRSMFRFLFVLSELSNEGVDLLLENALFLEQLVDGVLKI